MKVHIRYKGESQTLDGEQYGLTATADDETVRNLLAEIYEAPASTFKKLVIDRNPDGIVVRPPAVFG